MDAATITPGLHERRPAAFHAAHSSVSGRTHLDVFSGIGGFVLAAQWTGWRTIGVCENEPRCADVLAKNWPNIPNYGDIHTMRAPRAELVTGGFPCQPWSTCGPRRGKSDARNLWPEMRRIIQESECAWVLAENVPALDGMALDEVLADLEALGYEVAPPLEIPAGAVGAEHRRPRLWLAAYSASNAGKFQSGERENLRDESAIDGSPWPALENPWRLEPVLARTGNGLPGRSHRYKQLGNAIVPQVAAVLMRGMARTQNEKLTDCPPNT